MWKALLLLASACGLYGYVAWNGTVMTIVRILARRALRPGRRRARDARPRVEESAKSAASDSEEEESPP